jgi:copper resistance protein C
VGGVEDETRLLPDPGARALQDVDRQVHDRAARAALRVDVRIACVHEVIGRRTVPDVHVLDDAEVAQGLQGPVDAGAMDPGVDVRDAEHHVLRPQVAAGGREHGEHGLARARHALAACAQELPDVLDELRDGRLLSRFGALVHAVIVPAHRRRRLEVVESALPRTDGPPRARRRLLACVAAVPLLGALLGVLLVVGAAPASAHAVLVSSDPASGSSVPTPPSGITLTFDEAVRAPAYIVVTGPGGVRADEGGARIQGAKVTTALRRTVSAGSYSVAYRVVSDDGHPVEAVFTYTVTAGATSSSTAPAPPGSAAPSAAQSAAPTSAATAAASGADSGHLVHVLGGLAVVVAGAGALVYERVQRRRHPEDSAASR